MKRSEFSSAFVYKLPICHVIDTVTSEIVLTINVVIDLSL